MLQSVVVLDLSLQLPGPYATMLLASLGAEVIKVEPPGGDPARELDPRMFEIVNRGKGLLCLDLKRVAGERILRRLAESADVLVEGFRPGVAARLGFEWDRMKRLNARLIYCALSGYGQEGPMAAVPAHDINFLASSGALGLEPTGPRPIGTPNADLAAGTTAAFAVTAALFERERTGRGQYIDLAIADIATAWALVKSGPSTGASVEAAYGIFETRDAHRVAVAVIEDAHWHRLCSSLGWGDWRDDPRFSSHERRQAVAQVVQERLAAQISRRSLHDFLALADSFDLPITAVLESHEDVARTEQAAVRQLVDSRGYPRPPVISSESQHAATVGLGAPGADGIAILRRFGFSDAAIRDGQASGALLGTPAAASALEDVPSGSGGG